MRSLIIDIVSTVALVTLGGNHQHHQTTRGRTGCGISCSSSTFRSSSSSLLASSDSTTETPVTATNKYDDLLNWLKSNGNVYVNEKIALQPSTRGGGYGAFITGSTDDDNNDTDNKQPLVDVDEILFTIPRSMCITLDDATTDTELGEGFRSLIEKAGPGGNTVVLAGYLAAEWLKCSNSSTSSEEGNDNFQSNNSRYGPYLATLPWSRGTNSQEHILYWNDDEIESTLTGSMCYGEALDLRKEVSIAIKVLNTIVCRSKQKQQQEAEQNTGFRLPWQRPEKLPIQEINGLADGIRGAFVSILTRAFEDDYGSAGDDKEKLVPLLDMLQHSDEPNVKHAMRKMDGAVEVRARTPLFAGDELLNQYRSELEESMPYHRFFTRFGFVPGITEPIENLFQDKSSIFFAQKAEV